MHEKYTHRVSVQENNKTRVKSIALRSLCPLPFAGLENSFTKMHKLIVYYELHFAHAEVCSLPLVKNKKKKLLHRILHESDSIVHLLFLVTCKNRYFHIENLIEFPFTVFNFAINLEKRKKMLK